jgi:hypothetical protein
VARSLITVFSVRTVYAVILVRERGEYSDIAEHETKDPLRGWLEVGRRGVARSIDFVRFHPHGAAFLVATSPTSLSREVSQIGSVVT